MRYLALGDSYTIGTGASSPAHSWPAIIARRLAQEIGGRALLTNPAVNGFTTLDLIEDELPVFRRLKPDLVTILIGVNDLVRGRTQADYRASIVRIYDEVGKGKAPDGRVFAVSIPNWSVVPAAREYGDPERDPRPHGRLQRHRPRRGGKARFRMDRHHRRQPLGPGHTRLDRLRRPAPRRQPVRSLGRGDLALRAA